MLRRNVLRPSLGSKNKLSNKPAKAGSWFLEVLTMKMTVLWDGTYIVLEIVTNISVERAISISVRRNPEDAGRTLHRNIGKIYQTTWCHIPEGRNLHESRLLEKI
jgi:hypothetical protein